MENITTKIKGGLGEKTFYKLLRRVHAANFNRKDYRL